MLADDLAPLLPELSRRRLAGLDGRPADSVAALQGIEGLSPPFSARCGRRGARLAATIGLAAAVLGCEASLAEPSSGLRHVCELNAAGEEKACHDEEFSSSRDFESTQATLRCWQTVEGDRINCHVVRAPDAAQYQLLEFAKRSHGKPLVRDGKRVEGWVYLVTRVQMVDRP